MEVCYEFIILKASENSLWEKKMVHLPQHPNGPFLFSVSCRAEGVRVPALCLQRHNVVTE